MMTRKVTNFDESRNVLALLHCAHLEQLFVCFTIDVYTQVSGVMSLPNQKTHLQDFILSGALQKHSIMSSATS